MSRKRKSYIALMRGVMYVCSGLTAALLLFLLGYVLYKGIPNISWEFLSTKPSHLTERIGILHWNAFMDVEGDLLTAAPGALAASLNLRVVQYLAAVQTLLPRLAAERGAVLATSGVMALDDAAINALAGGYGILAVSVAAQHKANALLAPRLAAQGVYLGEVVVAGFVQHTPGAEQHPHALNPDDIAQSFWDLHSARQVHSLIFGAAARPA